MNDVDVDCNGALIGNHYSICRLFEWTVKVAFYFIEEAILNSVILFDKVKPGKLHFINFKMDIIDKHDMHTPSKMGTVKNFDFREVSIKWGGRGLIFQRIFGRNEKNSQYKNAYSQHKK